jgi:predicted SAM-dependent methyltransferase
MIRQSIKDAYFHLVRYLSMPSTALARLRYRLRPPAHPEGHYVHLGCGHKYLPGLINADGNVFQKIDLWIDLRNGLPFPDKSCAVVYSSHTLEHLFPYEAITLLKEIRRVLTDDGVARIAVPSMEYALAVATGGNTEDWPRPFRSPASQAVNYLFCDGQHKYAYTYEILRDFAAEAGFDVITHTSALFGTDPRSYGHVELGDEPEGSLIVDLQR